jgi:hypothetical protein
MLLLQHGSYSKGRSNYVLRVRRLGLHDFEGCYSETSMNVDTA